MKLQRIAVRGYRNLAPQVVPLERRFVVVHGENGQGKTNLLEAAWILASLKGWRARRHKDLIAHGGEEATVAGLVESEGISRRYRLVLSAGARRTFLEDKPTADLRVWFEGIRAIAFTPSDGAIVTGEPALRRDWLDRAAFTASPAHLSVVHAVRRILAHKAAVLRDGARDRALLDVLDQQLASHGAELAARREALLAELSPHIAALHEEIAGGSGLIGLRYRTAAPGAERAAREVALHQKLLAARDGERRRGMVLAGPQTDELEITLDDQPARAFGSRGQVRSIVLALKLAELVAATRRGEAPLFLLDDLSSELDRARTQKLVALLARLPTQVLVSTTDPAHLGELPDVRYLAVRAGRIDGASEWAPAAPPGMPSPTSTRA